MAVLKCSFFALMALLTLAICSAHKVKPAGEPDPGKKTISKPWNGHIQGGGGGGMGGGGSSGGGWSGGGGGSGSFGGGGYGWGWGYGGGGGGGGGHVPGIPPKGTPPAGDVFSCQPVTCPAGGCEGFTLYLNNNHAPADNGMSKNGVVGDEKYNQFDAAMAPRSG